VREFPLVLHGSGDTPQNHAFLAQLAKAFPPREFEAVLAWVSTFYGYQQNWLLDTSRFSALIKCRQIGGSHTYAAAGLLWALLGEETTIVSVGEREATEVLTKAALHAEALAQLGSHWARTTALSKTRITVESGGSVAAVPATSGGRGRSGNMLLDEMAYYEHPLDVWDGASATVMHGYRLRALSTPNGVGNLFHDITANAKKHGYRLHRVTLEEAIVDGLRVNLKDCWRMARGDQRVFNQLFCCEFLDGELQYIPTEFVERAREDFPPETQGYAFAGLDIGRTADRTELRVIRGGADGRYHVVWQDTCKRTSQQDIDRIVRKAFGSFNIRRLCVDSTGIGAFPAEGLQREHGRARVDPVNFTLKSKEELATALYTIFASDRIRIPRADVQLFDDICSVQRKITDAGNVQYDAPHTDAGHADSAWALALAVYAASQQPTSRAQTHSNA